MVGLKTTSNVQLFVPAGSSSASLQVSLATVNCGSLVVTSPIPVGALPLTVTVKVWVNGSPVFVVPKS